MIRILLIFFAAFICGPECFGQIIWTEPAFPTLDDVVTMYYDIAEGNAALANEEPPCPPCPFVYAHTGVITSESTSPSDWQYVHNPWPTGSNNSAANNGNTLLPFDGTVHSFDFGGLTLAEYYGVPEGVVIEQLAFVFRNFDGSAVGKTADEGDIFYTVSDGSFEVVLTNPVGTSSIESVGTTMNVIAQASQTASLTLDVNGETVASANGTSLEHSLSLSAPGDYTIEVHAEVGSLTSTASSAVFVLPESAPVLAPPAGLKDGINHLDDNTVILQWTAPYKDFVFAVGDFNDWTLNGQSLMHDVGNGETFWIQLDDLTPGQDYRYQYHILPDDICVADAYAEVILDKWNDPWIPESTYPNLPPYPDLQASGPVSVFTPGEAAFDWTDDSYVRPDQENLVIYELLVRDFSEERTLKFIEDSLDYLERLGVQALELMPVNEFNGNDSWGYNPTFYFAVDKAYGTKNDLKSLVDACHERGIAVILDVVYNHADQPNPFITMYWEDWTVLPFNPWFNTTAPHNFTWFHDWNHGSSRTRDFVKRNLKFWVDEFHIDGFRWDFSQGIIQQQGVDGGYNQQRINWLKAYGDHVWNDDPTVYMILEHWCDFNEERELADYNGMNGDAAGFMLWANATNSYQEASMGYSNNDLSWANFQSHNFQDRHAVAYAESHDEERLMYKNLQMGNSNGDYNASEMVIALRRQQLSMAFNLLMPGPRMLWQFEELGYDYSINTCTDGATVNEDCRIAAKPVRWDYYNEPERRHLYDVSGALAALKRDYPAFGPSATSFNVDVGGGYGKRMHFEHPDGDAIVVGNYKVTAIDMVPGFTHTGTWYDHLTGEALVVSDLNASMPFAPGEMHVYTDVPLPTPFLTEIDVDLDGQLASEGDCNANDATIYTGAVDVANDGIDQDCDGTDLVSVGMLNLSVDMSAQEISADGVHIAGNFQGWNPSSHQLDSVGNGVFGIAIPLTEISVTSLEFKFINGNSWTAESEFIDGPCGNANGNRIFELDNLIDSAALQANSDGDAFCFNSCETCVEPLAVTFNIDMSVVATVSENGVHLAGSFQGWDPAGTPLSDNGDGTWSATVEMEPGTYEFKVINSNAWDGNEENMEGSGCNNGGNRIATFDADNNTYTACFNTCPGESCTPDPDPADITFRVNMANQELAEGQAVFVWGGFTGWQGGAIEMTDADGDGIWEHTETISGGANVDHKYSIGHPNDEGVIEEDGVYVLDGDTTNWVAAGCGLDNGFSGYNRRHVRSGLAEVLDVVCFNACSDCDDLTSQMSGCTDSIATNYDADAVVDDDSCVYNDDCSLACGPGTYWDASDQLCLPIISADLDLDGCVGSSDLLELLTQFGLCN